MVPGSVDGGEVGVGGYCSETLASAVVGCQLPLCWAVVRCSAACWKDVGGGDGVLVRLKKVREGIMASRFVLSKGMTGDFGVLQFIGRDRWWR